MAAAPCILNVNLDFKAVQIRAWSAEEKAEYCRLVRFFVMFLKQKKTNEQTKTHVSSHLRSRVLDTFHTCSKHRTFSASVL